MNVPANISHVVIVHGGSYNDFLNKINTKYPNLLMRFTKKVATHYYIIQLEDEGVTEVTKQELYDLPIIAMREEFSGYIFFKSVAVYFLSVVAIVCTSQ